MQCLVKSNPEVKALLKKYTDILGSESAAYYVVSMNNGLPLDQAPDGTESELYSALIASGMEEKDAVLAKSVIYTPLYMDKYGDWSQDYDALNGSQEPSITTLTVDSSLSDHATIQGILNNPKVVVDQLTALERSNIVDSTPAILSAVRKERQDYVNEAVDNWLATKPTTPDIDAQRMRVVSKAEAEFDSQTMDKTIVAIQQYLAQQFPDVQENHSGPGYEGTTKLGQMRANFINSLANRFEHPGMTTMSRNQQQLISVHLMNSVLNNRDLSTTIPAMAEQYIRMFQDSDFIQDLFQVIKDVHGKDTHPERMIKLATDYVTGKLQTTEQHQKLQNIWFSISQFFRGLFRQKTKKQNRALERNMLDALAVYFSCANDLARSTDKELNTIFYTARPKKQHVTAKDAIREIKKGIQSRIIALQKSQSAAMLGDEAEQLTELKERLAQLDNISNLEDSQQDTARVAAMEQFVIKGLTELASALQLIEKMKSGPIEQVNAAQLDNIQHNVIGFYKNLIQEWILKWAMEDKSSSVQQGSSFMDAVDIIQKSINRIEADFDQLNLLYTEHMLEELSKKLVIGDVARFVYNMRDWLQNKINGGHLSFFDRWLKGGFASDSMVIRLFDFALRQANNLTRNTTDTVGRTLHQAYMAAEKEFRKVAKNPFINYVKLLYERDEHGDYTGNLRSSINRGAFERKVNDKKKELIKKYNAVVDENDGTISFSNDDDWRGYNDELDEYIEKVGGHRRYKSWYYIERRKHLSKTTIDIIDNLNKEIREIENKCIEEVEITLSDGSKRTIKAPLTYKLKTQSDRDRLVELRRQKENLSNPYNIVYDAQGKISSITPKSGEAARIAQEIISWRTFQRNSGALKYKSNTHAYKLVRQKLLDDYTAKIGVETNPLTGQKYTQLDVDQLLAKFDFENSTTQLSQEYYDELEKILGGGTNFDRAELNARKNAIMRACYKRRGFFNPDLDKLSEDAWAELKRIDEALDGTSSGKKLSKDDIDKLKSLSGEVYVKRADTGENYYNWLKDRYIAAGKYDEFLQKYTFSATVKKYTKLPDGSTKVTEEKVIRPLSVFTYKAPLNPNWVESPGGTGIFSEVDQWSSNAIDDKYDPTDTDQIQVDKDMYYDKEFDELMKNKKIKAFYDECLKALDNAWSKLPSTYRRNRYRLPQRRDELGSISTRKHGAKAWWNAIKGEFKVNETDVDYNEEFTRRPDGSFVETIPLRYIRDLEDKNMIDTDIVSLLTDFTEMAQNFENKQAMQPLWELVGFQLRGGFAGRSEGISDQSKRFDTHKSMYMYGRMRMGVNPGVKMGRVQQIVSKLMYKMMSLAHSKLMVHNWPAVLKNWWDSGSTLYAEIASGRDFDVSCFKNAIWRMSKDLPNTVMSMPLGRTHTRCETAAMMQANGISSSIHEMFRGTNKAWARRILENHGSMGEYSLVDYMYKGLITQMIYDSVRLIEDPLTGEQVFATKQQAQYYYTKAGYTAKEGKKAWRKGIPHVDATGKTVYARVTLADAFYVEQNGKYTLKPEFEDLVRPVIDESTGRRSNKLETQVEGFIRERSSVVNGMLDTYDRNGAQTNFIGAAIMQMRGWAIAQQVDYNKDGHDFAVYAEDDEDFDKNSLQKLYGKAIRNAYDSGAGLVVQEASEGYEGQYDFLAGGTRQGAWTLIPFLKAYAKLFQDLNFIKFAIPDTALDKIGVESSTLTDQQKYIIARMNCTLLSIAATSLITFLSGKGIEDDPDEWILWLLYAASTAGISERAAQVWFPGLVFTLTDIVKTPAVSTAYYQDFGYALDAIQDLMALMYDKATGGSGNIEAHQQITSGAYKGKEKWQRDVSRASSLIPGISELGFDNLYRRGVFDGSVNGLRSTATWYYQVFPTNTLVYRPQVTTEKGKLRKAKEGELKPQRGVYGLIYNEKGTSFSDYFYDTNTSMTDKLKLMMFGYKDNDNGDSNKSRKEIKKPKLNWGN